MASGLARIFAQRQTGDWIGQAIERAYSAQRVEHWEPPTLEVHPSSAGSACPRDIELYMLGYRDQVTAKGLRRMNNGTGAHDRWNQYFADLGILHDANRRLTVPDVWSGECDLLLNHPVTGRPVLVEIKTMNANRYRQVPEQHEDRRAMARLLHKAEPSYVRQLTQYWLMFRKEWPEISEECAFLFENTDTQEYKIRYLIPDVERVADAFLNSTVARTAVVQGALLEPPYRMQSVVCRKCYRESVCYALQRGDPEHTAAVDAALSHMGERVGRLGIDQFDPPPFGVVAGSAEPQSG